MAHRVFSKNKNRVLPVCAVATLHAFLIYAIHHALRFEREHSPDLYRPLLLVPVQKRIRDESPERPREVLPQHATSRASSNPEPSNLAEFSLPASIAWRANAAYSAHRTVEDGLEEGVKSFGPPKPPPPEEPETPSIFGKTPKQLYGEVLPDDPIVWLNDYCYMFPDRPVQTARTWAGATTELASPVTCKGQGSAEPDGTLFMHIKPREEPPVPKAGTEMHPLPQRIEEGGVFER